VKPLILLDFDGVLFNSAYEAFQVCEHVAKNNAGYRNGLSFDEFMEFRAHLTDAWQFCRLYRKDQPLKDFRLLHEAVADEGDWAFSKQFFAARAEMMKDPDWAKLMSPYPFFYQLRPLLTQYPDTFRILSTRNRLSIQRTLDFYAAGDISVHGQEDIREYGSKLAVAKSHQWLQQHYVVYIDDMNAHLEPFLGEVDMCIHAGWGYDTSHADSFTQGQSFQVISGFLRLAHE
jgi:hypothetical protein